MLNHCWEGATVRLLSLIFSSSVDPEGALLSLHSVLFRTVPGCIQELCVSDSWCGRKVEGGGKKPSQGKSFRRAPHTNHTPASEKAQGVCLLCWRKTSPEPPIILSLSYKEISKCIMELSQFMCVCVCLNHLHLVVLCFFPYLHH